MNTSAAVSRADLLRCLAAPGGLDDTTAAFLGFVRKGAPNEVKSAWPPAGADTGVRDPSAPEIEEIFPVTLPGQRHLRFLMPMSAETLVHETRPAPPRGNPITDKELAVPWHRPGPPLSPLARWPRLAPYLRGRLGAVLPGTRLDLRRLILQVGRGLPLLSLPRLPRAAWAAQAVVLWDETPEMVPFREDMDFLLRRLRCERGKHGLAIRLVKSLPEPSLLARVPPETPVLALSAMGQFLKAEGIAHAWVTLARHLAFRGHAFHALTPCPRHRWHPELAAAWPSAVWDRRPRLPRQGGLSFAPGAPRDSTPTVERLLDLLSPATRIESPLLRAARLLVGAGADAGTEYDAWHHVHCWKSIECFGFWPGDAYDKRLRARADLAGENPELAAKVAGLIGRHHETLSIVIAAEAELRACLSGSPDPATLERVKALLQRVVERLREMAPTPGSADGRSSGVASWFESMVDRLSPEIRSDEAVWERIAQGLALAKVFSEAAHTVWPEGVDVDAAKAEMLRVGKALAAPADYRLALRGGELDLRPGSTTSEGMPLTLLTTGHRHVHLTFDPSAAAGGSNETVQIPLPAAPVRLTALAAPVSLRVESDRQRLHFAPVERPAWARRMFYDRFGLAAEFRIGSVPFVLRWIPPGRFLMGSPDDEPERYPNEGPRHEVTISRGFWLGETPVTQAQWKAVVTEAGKSRSLMSRLLKKNEALSPEPSQFKGPDALPVEQVSWHDSVQVCQLLDGLLERQLHFTLPTEAQWEYACRAGTESALYNGGITIRGENDAPELDAIAWYGGNSGNDLEIENPYDSADWPNKQYPHKKAGTHRVKLKEPNSWGLHDMIGNVWEWCLDGRRDYTSESQRDPVGPMEESASRVVRGGSWDGRARSCRAAFRDRFEPGFRWGLLGFRLAAGQEPSAAEPLGAERPLEGKGGRRG